ncbi:hypothetical protein WN50_14450 [Limnoraphis robusta CS-951]|uniref:Organic solvent tolerance protein OstA n=2 Tax=Limnoraphis TaxID=1332112 RepID=A0A0F5YFK0_9CYAN|nr:hypothetical protein WN50_14450 [Limnoraphis robusta CS-951]
MPYPVPPPEPPPLVQTLPDSTLNPLQPQTVSTPMQLSSDVVSPKQIHKNETVAYQLPKLKALEQELASFSPSTSVSADSLGPALSLGLTNSQLTQPQIFSPLTTKPSGEADYQVAKSFSFSDNQNLTTDRLLSQTPSQPSPETVPIPVILPTDLVEVTADRQEFDQQRQIITTEGNVMIRFQNTLIDADKAQVNLNTRQVVASGNVALTRENQVIRGQRMDYNLVKSTGVISNASGVISLSDLGPGLAAQPLQEQGVGQAVRSPISDRITSAQPVENVAPTEGADVEVSGLSFPDLQGDVNRLRFEAERIDILPNGEWEAQDVRITNDPFSPPELELRADTARLQRISPLQDEILTTGSRLVFDQKFSLPLFRDRTVIDRRQREPAPFSIGYDLDDLGGYYVEWNVSPVRFGPIGLDISPQFLLQRAFEEDLNPSDGGFYGLQAELSGPLSPYTFFDSRLSITNFEDFPDLEEDEYRASLRVRQLIGGYTLTGEYSYRDRIFNGTLGFRTIQRSAGAVLTSPEILLGDSGAVFRFQGGLQQIEARTDRLDILNQPGRDNDRITRTRFQGLATLIYPPIIWQGKALPATPTEGLKYTARPVVPFIRLIMVAQGVTSIYTEDDSQSYLSGTVGLQGQFGHFSRDFLDYTGFNLLYTQVALDGQSPFLFDRRVDESILTFGLVQQIYGGLRAGFEYSINLENGLAVDNEFSLEYSRRTYGVILRVSPVRRVGSLNLRISDFNWTGGSEPFSGIKD